MIRKYWVTRVSAAAASLMNAELNITKPVGTTSTNPSDMNVMVSVIEKRLSCESNRFCSHTIILGAWSSWTNYEAYGEANFCIKMRQCSRRPCDGVSVQIVESKPVPYKAGNYIFWSRDCV